MREYLNDRMYIQRKNYLREANQNDACSDENKTFSEKGNQKFTVSNALQIWSY